MPLSPPLVLEVGSDTKFQLLLLFNIVGPFLGLTRNLRARHYGSKVQGSSHLTLGLWIQKLALIFYTYCRIKLGKNKNQSRRMVKKTRLNI
jgi:hypothetical protein